jgi:hypothetical protein
MSKLIYNRLSFLVVIIFSFSLQPSQLHSQVPDYILDSARNVTFNERIPTTFYATEQRGSWTLNAIYHQPSDQSAAEDAYWIIRRTSGRADTPSDHVMWADSRSCPALHGALWWMSRLEPPAVDILGLTPRQPAVGGPPAIMRADAPIYTIWGLGHQADNSPAWVRMRSNSGLLGEWGDATESNLRECWSEDAP